MKQKIDIKDLDINQAPPCYLVETDEHWGYIVAKGSLKELEIASIGTQWANLFSGTFGIDTEDEGLYPEEFDYVIVKEETASPEFDGYNIYNYDNDPCGVYCPKISLEEIFGSGGISIDDIIDEVRQEESGAIIISTESNSRVTLHAISQEGMVRALGNNVLVTNTKLFSSHQCSCEHDCCGCISSQTLEIIDNNNGWLSVFLTTNWNY